MAYLPRLTCAFVDCRKASLKLRDGLICLLLAAVRSFVPMLQFVDAKKDTDNGMLGNALRLLQSRLERCIGARITSAASRGLAMRPSWAYHFP